MSRPIIEVRNLAKVYQLGAIGATSLKDEVQRFWAKLRSNEEASRQREFWALRDVSFDVRRGEVVGIVGRNGAGKSTLLKILSRITEPTSGEVTLRGRVASLLEVGTGFHPDLSGRENIFLNGAILGMSQSEIQSKLDEIIAFAEVEQFIDTPVKRYSSGMYVRLAFAVAAHLEPEILIVDEVLAVGDAQFQNKCLGKMGEVAKGGRTVLFVSHNSAAISQLCDEAVLLRGGQFVMKDEARKVLSAYLSDTNFHRDGIYDLTTTEVRPKGARCIIRSLRLSAGAGNTNTFQSAGRFIAELELDAPKRLREPRLAIAFEDTYGRRITTVASYFEREIMGELQGPAVYRAEIPQLRLGPGRYLISVSIADKYEGLLDSLVSVACCEVEWANNFSHFEPYHEVYGPVLHESNWARVS